MRNGRQLRLRIVPKFFKCDDRREGAMQLAWVTSMLTIAFMLISACTPEKIPPNPDSALDIKRSEYASSVPLFARLGESSSLRDNAKSIGAALFRSRPGNEFCI